MDRILSWLHSQYTQIIHMAADALHQRPISTQYYLYKGKPYGNKLLIKVKDEVKLVIDATPGYEPYDRQKIIEQNKKNTVRHAYFRE